MSKYEKIDTTPVVVPLGYGAPETLEQKIKRMVRSEQLANLARAAGKETFEESLDFDVEDDIAPQEPGTPYEHIADREDEILHEHRRAVRAQKMAEREEQFREAKAKRAKRSKGSSELSDKTPGGSHGKSGKTSGQGDKAVSDGAGEFDS